MRRRRVIAGKQYRFEPVGMDLWSPSHQGLEQGDVVTVRNLFGCPPANTMGHCHVYRDGELMGLVLTNSLQSM